MYEELLNSFRILEKMRYWHRGGFCFSYMSSTTYIQPTSWDLTALLEFGEKCLDVIYLQRTSFKVNEKLRVKRGLSYSKNVYPYPAVN